MRRQIVPFLLLLPLALSADIFMMGDSTMCDYKPGSYPQEGWGQRLRTFMKEGVKVQSMSAAARSTARCRRSCR